MDIRRYTDASATLDVPIRYARCPWCNTEKNSFLVIPRSKGYFLYCHYCHRKLWIPRGPKTPREMLNQLTEKEVAVETSLMLPTDCSSKLPFIAKAWLSKYLISKQDIEEYKFCYSPSSGRLYLPIYKNGELVYYTARCLQDYKKLHIPKYIARTKRGESFAIIKSKQPSTSVVIVEDLISAIRISKIGIDACCIFGSYISDKIIFSLSNEYEKIIIWLDPDKNKEAAKKVQRFKSFGLPTIFLIILTALKDPKDYKDKELKSFLHK